MVAIGRGSHCPLSYLHTTHFGIYYFFVVTDSDHQQGSPRAEQRPKTSCNGATIYRRATNAVLGSAGGSSETLVENGAASSAVAESLGLLQLQQLVPCMGTSREYLSSIASGHFCLHASTSGPDSSLGGRAGGVGCQPSNLL